MAAEPNPWSVSKFVHCAHVSAYARLPSYLVAPILNIFVPQTGQVP